MPICCRDGNQLRVPSAAGKLLVAPPGSNCGGNEAVLWPSASELRWICGEPSELRCTPALLASMTYLAFLAGSALTGGVWKPSKQFLFLQPGPALTGPGFLKPCVSAPVSINWGGSQLQHRVWLNWQARPSHQSVRAVCPSPWAPLQQVGQGNTLCPGMRAGQLRARTALPFLLAVGHYGHRCYVSTQTEAPNRTALPNTSSKCRGSPRHRVETQRRMQLETQLGPGVPGQHHQSVQLQELQSGAKELHFLFSFTKERFNLKDNQWTLYWPIPASVPSQTKWVFEQPGLLKVISDYGRGVATGYF